MKALIAAAVLTLLAGCAGMGMGPHGHGDSSGDMGMHSGASGQDYNAQKDVSHIWVGS